MATSAALCWTQCLNVNISMFSYAAFFALLPFCMFENVIFKVFSTRWHSNHWFLSVISEQQSHYSESTDKFLSSKVYWKSVLLGTYSRVIA